MTSAADRVYALWLTPGEVVYRWWDSGMTHDVQPLQVIRVNSKTVTVRTEQGNVFRLRMEDLVGRYTEDDAHFPEGAQK